MSASGAFDASTRARVAKRVFRLSPAWLIATPVSVWVRLSISLALVFRVTSLASVAHGHDGHATGLRQTLWQQQGESVRHQFKGGRQLARHFAVQFHADRL